MQFFSMVEQPLTTITGKTSFISQSECYLHDENSLYLYICRYHLEQYQPSLFDTLKVFFPATIERSVAKRQAEFLAGRYAAKQVLALLNVTDKPILSAKSRAPIWPDRVAGSLSHNEHYAICAAVKANGSTFRLGVDVETWLSSSAAASAKKVVINDKETAYLLSCSMAFNQALTIVFSAKESLYKALYPEVNAFFDFSAVELGHFCTHTQQVTFSLLTTLAPTLLAGNVFTCRYHFLEGAVLTYINNNQ